MVVPDERGRISRALAAAATRHALIVTTGGTGLTPRDVTPQATKSIVDYEVPGMAEAMRAAGRLKTPFADLSRGIVGVRNRALIVNLPGSPKGAIESLEALVPVLDHALETLAGPHDHGTPPARTGGGGR
jgi:molybdenum cofactor synthesis domain-containing protein